MQNVVFGGAALALPGALRGGEGHTAPLATSPMPQPDAPVLWSVAFSPLTGRTAVSAGPDEDLTSLYVNTSSVRESFQVYWSPDTEVHGITALAWSRNEDALAFIGISGSRATKTAEVWVYTLEPAKSRVRRVLKIVEAQQGRDQRLVNVHEERATLAWFGENRICMNTRDNAIIAVERNNGDIETLVPAEDRKIQGLAAVSPGKLRFLRIRPSGQGHELEPYEFDGSKVSSLEIIPIVPNRVSVFSRLSADGGYVFVAMKESPKSTYDNTIVYDLSQMASVKEIPVTARTDSERYMYIPLTILKGEQLVLLERIQGKDQPWVRSRCRLVAVRL